MTQYLFKRVLLIEDDPAHTLIIKKALREACEEIIHCETLEEARKVIKDKNSALSLVITDLRLPDSKGVSFVGDLKTLSDAPLVVLTSSTSLDEAVEAMKLGAKDYLVKNFGPDFKNVLRLSLSRLAAALEVERERRKLEKQLLILKGAIESSRDGLGVVSQKGEVLYGNNALKILLNKVGASPLNVWQIDPSKIKGGKDFLLNLSEKIKELDKGGVWHTEFSLTSTARDNAGDIEPAYHLTLVSAEDFSEEKENSGVFVLWFRDITEQKRQERFQRDLLSTTTHDLKGPLGAVLTAAELLHNNCKDDWSLKLITRIQSAAQGSVQLIDELLSAARIEEGTLTLSPKLYDSKELLSEVMERYEAVAESRGLTLKWGIDKGEEKIFVDKIGFERVLSNLLSNACKFTPRGGLIEVEVKGSEDESKVVVRDTGCGINPDEIARIFERFGRLEKHKNTPGTGLGLFVVKSIVEGHGGKVEVSSVPQKGTVFTLTFPKKSSIL